MDVWNDGITEWLNNDIFRIIGWWSNGNMNLWTMTLWKNGTCINGLTKWQINRMMELLNHEIMEWCTDEIMKLWSDGLMKLWNYEMMILLNDGMIKYRMTKWLNDLVIELYDDWRMDWMIDWLMD